MISNPAKVFISFCCFLIPQIGFSVDDPEIRVDSALNSPGQGEDLVKSHQKKEARYSEELLKTTTLNLEQIQQSESYISDIKKIGFPFYDVVSSEDIHDFFDLREALAALKGHGLAKMLADEVIFQDLYKTLMNFTKFQSKAFVLSVENLDALEHNEWQLRKSAPVIDYPTKFEIIRPKPAKGCCLVKLFSSDPDFYKKIYKSLSDSKLLDAAVYPDEANGKVYNNNRKKKRDHLIHSLIAFKDPEQTRRLTSDIIAESDIYYPTTGLPGQWIAEMRYKLLHLSYVLPKLAKSEKVNVLNYLLHAGANCNDAKKSVIDDLFRLFCPEAYQSIILEEERAISGIKDRIQLIAVQEKTKKLERVIQVEVDAMIKGEIPKRIRRAEISREEMERERLSVIQATWDQYAHMFGVGKKNASYSAYAIELSQIFTDKGNYSPSHLFWSVFKSQTDIKHLILDDYIGVMKYVFSHHESAVLGALQDMEFLKPSW